MPIEPSFLSIADLNSAWPQGLDKYYTTDDHLRGVKNALKMQFPALNAAVTGLPADFNILTGGVAAGVTLARYQRLAPLNSAIIQENQRNIASGFCGLDGGALVPLAQLPGTMTGKTTTNSLQLGGFAASLYPRKAEAATITAEWRYNVNVNLANSAILRIRNNANTADWNILTTSTSDWLTIGTTNHPRVAFPSAQFRVEGEILVSNNRNLSFLNSTLSTFHTALNYSTGNVLTVGSVSASGLVLARATQVNGALTATGIVNATGLQIPNGTFLQGRNAANTAWASLIRMSSGNEVQLGSTSFPVGIYAGSGRIFLNSDVELAYGESIIGKNSLGSDRSLVHIDGSGVIRIGDPSTRVTILSPNFVDIGELGAPTVLRLNNNARLRGWNNADTDSLSLIYVTLGDIVSIGDLNSQGMRLASRNPTRYTSIDDPENFSFNEREIGYAFRDVKELNTPSTDYNITLHDNAKLLRKTNASNDILIPNDTTLNLPIGFWFYMLNDSGATDLNAFAGEGGVTIVDTIDAQIPWGSMLLFIKIGANRWTAQEFKTSP